MKLGDFELNQIYTGDARILAKGIPDESVDLIFADPPYSLKYLWCYNWLSFFARRVLKPNGFLLAMAGSYHLDKVFDVLGKQLVYFWEFQIRLTGSAAGCVWPRGNNKIRIVTRNKPLLAYCHEGSSALPRISALGTFSGTGSDKRYHVWGQDEASTRYYIDCFSAQRDVVVDPFCGGGTVPAVCKMLSRNYLAFEIDPDVAEIARERVANAQPPLPGLFQEIEQGKLKMG